jgi:hypothetical protein
MSAVTYGAAPQSLGLYDLSDWAEFMHYMYLPIVMPGQEGVRIPERLSFAAGLVRDVLASEGDRFDYAYLTTRRGYASPGNSLNRPGWHADGFGTEDVNFVWTDRWPTMYAVQDFGPVSDSHQVSMAQFEAAIDPARIRTYADSELLRLDQHVIHAAPEIPAPGGVRSFLKVSLSNERYNLAGNSHNYLFDYDWHMFTRDEIRNDPARAERDAVIEAA